MGKYSKGDKVKVVAGGKRLGEEAIIAEVRDSTYMFPYLIKFEDGFTLPAFESELAPTPKGKGTES